MAVNLPHGKQNQIEGTTEWISLLPREIDAQVFFYQILRLQKAKANFET